MKYKLVACGGTFDFLHEGHKAFLRFAFSKGEKVVIGLTTDDFVRNDKKTVSAFKERKKILEDFLKKENLLTRSEIIPLVDVYGPTLDSSFPIDGLIITEDTKKGAEEINSKRKQIGLLPIPIIAMQMLKENNTVISSSQIKKGIIDRKGEPFVRREYFSTTYFLPAGLRVKLHEPFGKVYQNGLSEVKQLDPKFIAAIGDVTAKRFNENGIEQKISVVDFVVERKKSFESLKELGFTSTEEVVYVSNLPGSITPSTWKEIAKITRHLSNSKRFVIVVDGEEDLVFIPLLLSLPLGFHLFYGQPHIGFVRVDVTLENKEKMREIFREFSASTTRGY